MKKENNILRVEIATEMMHNVVGCKCSDFQKEEDAIQKERLEKEVKKYLEMLNKVKNMDKDTIDYVIENYQKIIKE